MQKLNKFFFLKKPPNGGFFLEFFKETHTISMLFYFPILFMIIKLVGSGLELESLRTSVTRALNELALDDAVKLEVTDDAAYKMELGITENPALCIEEESIDFRDMIFQ